MEMLTIVLLATFCFVSSFTETNLRSLSKKELEKLLSAHRNISAIQITRSRGLQRNGYASIPPDNGGNYGDLMHLRRQNGDVLLMRETVINEFANSRELDMYWYGNFPARISHVRTLNFGRERGFTLEIRSKPNQGYVEVFFRIPPFKVIRMFIEIYGFS